jgi:outer membrane lipoprotein-sorting protein
MRITKLALYASVALVSCITTAKAQTADEIIRKHIEAMGGTEKWNKITSMKLSGSMSMQGTEINMTQTVVNDKGMRMDISVMGMNGYTIVTPKEGWAFLPFQPGMDKVMPLPPDQLKASQEKLDIKNGLLVDKVAITKAEYIGKDTVNTISCYKVKVTDKDGKEQTDFFDASNYYLVRTELKMKVQDEDQEMAFNFSNFQKQPEGVVYPMTIGTPQGDFVFKTIELNKPISDDVFKPSGPETKK